MSRIQYELTYLIGYQGFASPAFDNAIINHASYLCGGCFVSDGTGYWVDDQTNRIQNTFEGETQKEHCLAINVTVEPHKLSIVLASMQNFISETVVAMGLPIEWVHVQKKQIRGYHFNVQDHLVDVAKRTNKTVKVRNNVVPLTAYDPKPNLYSVSGYSQNRGDV